MILGCFGLGCLLDQSFTSLSTHITFFKHNLNLFLNISLHYANDQCIKKYLFYP